MISKHTPKIWVMKSLHISQAVRMGWAQVLKNVTRKSGCEQLLYMVNLSICAQNPGIENEK